MSKVYKIFYKDKALIICSTGYKLLSDFEKPRLEAKFPEKKKFLIPYLDLLEKSKRYKNIILFSNEPKRDFLIVKNCYYQIRAGGGFVFNPKGEVVAIYKNELWDLPKGKEDPGENSVQCATREVKEETGIKKLKVGEKVGSTYHVFKSKKGRTLKKTNWYKMHAPSQKLSPQLEENIELVEWKDWFELKDEFRYYYRNLYEFMNEHEDIIPKSI